MKLQHVITILIMLVFFSLTSTTVYALNENTHEELNRRIARDYYPEFPFASYLKENLNMKDGFETTISKDGITKEVWDWVAFGGKYEDIPQLTVYAGNIDLLDFNADYIRSINHFHDPLVPDWNDAGFSGETFLLSHNLKERHF